MKKSYIKQLVVVFTALVLLFGPVAAEAAPKVSNIASTSLTLNVGESLSITAPSSGTMSYAGGIVSSNSLPIVVTYNLNAANYSSGLYLFSYLTGTGFPGGGLANFSASYNSGTAQQCNISGSSGLTGGATGTILGAPAGTSTFCGAGFTVQTPTQLTATPNAAQTVNVVFTDSVATINAGTYTITANFVAGAF